MRDVANVKGSLCDAASFYLFLDGRCFFGEQAYRLHLRKMKGVSMISPDISRAGT